MPTRASRAPAVKPSRQPQQAAFRLRSGGFVGVPDPPPTLPDGFMKRQEIAAGPDYQTIVEPPRWFLDEIKKGAKPAAIIELLRRRVPKESNLREAQAVLNDIGRQPGGARIVRKVLTQRLFAELSKGVR